MFGKRFRATPRRHVPVAKKIVDFRQSGGAHIVMADLDRRRPAAGDEGTVLVEMRRENDEDVNPVFDDFVGDLRIVQSNGRPPDIAGVFEQSRCRIRMRNFGIGVDCEPRAIEPLEDWQHVEPNGMRPKSEDK